MTTKLGLENWFERPGRFKRLWETCRNHPVLISCKTPSWCRVTKKTVRGIYSNMQTLSLFLSSGWRSWRFLTSMNSPSKITPRGLSKYLESKIYLKLCNLSELRGLQKLGFINWSEGPGGLKQLWKLVGKFKILPWHRVTTTSGCRVMTKKRTWWLNGQRSI